MLVVDKLLLSMALFASDPAATPQTKDAKANKPPTALGPAETVQAYFQAIAELRPEDTWKLVPPSHREKFNKTVRQSAAAVDPVLWNKWFALFRKLTGTFKSKRTFWLQLLKGMASDDKDSRPLDLDVMIQLSDLIIESELADLEKLKNFDGGRFLENTVKPLLKLASRFFGKDDIALIESLRNAKTTVVSQKPGEATVRIEVAGQSGEITIVNVEGYWTLGDESVDDAAPIQVFQVDEEARKKWLAFIDLIDKRLDRMAAAKSQEEFEDAYRGAFKIVMPSVITWISQQASQSKEDEKGQDGGR